MPTIDTSDANATAGDILSNKTAYVNGQKITGNISVLGPGASSGATSATYNSTAQILSLGADFTSTPKYINKPFSMTSGAARVVSAIGLTADILKKDEVVLGVTGTYEGGASQYNGEFAEKLPSSSQYNTIQRYIKETPEIDLDGRTSCSNFFANGDCLEKVTLFDTSNVTNMKSMFQNCINLLSIPQFNTEKVTDMTYMFQACEKLTTVPILDTHLVQAYYMSNMYQGCVLLSNESLNNILYMCANCKTGGTAQQKTLQWLGLTSSQASTCATLSNWSAFTSAGWSTGY